MPSSTTTDVVIGVAVPVPGLGVLSYRVPGRASGPPKGARVAVPLGSRTVIGCVVSTEARAPDGAVLRDVVTVVDDHPFLPAEVVDLALWVGDYYLSGPGEALAMALPPSARTGTGGGFRTRTVALATATAARLVPRGARQREALDRLAASPDGVDLAELARAGIGGRVLQRLAGQGHVTLRTVVDERDPFAPSAEGRAPWSIAGAETIDRPLTDEQTRALNRLRPAIDAGEFRTVLLHGVTGSGKTEVYLRLARHAVALGRSVLVLVPEIALTPALAGLFRRAFGDRVAMQHSGLSAGERHDQWHRVRRGAADIVVGTRSAVFAPFDRVGLVIVDEEHEASYKQEEAPRYHGRDVAVMRGRMAGALVLLGSATPSLESAVNARAGRYEQLVLTRRVLDRPLAEVRVVDMRREIAAEGVEVALSSVLAEAIARRLERGEQSLVLLNRRGFATVVFCRGCGASIECPHCSVVMTYHRRARQLRCHYCNASRSLPVRCDACGGQFLEHSGVGTERLEVEVRTRFPSARVARVDRDTIRRRGALARVLSAVSAGDVDVLVGTQMIAKGHDFPSVTLVGVVSADVGLGMADFRAAERTFQLLTQVVGRAGRGNRAGEAVIQTLYPEHYSVRAAAAQDYAAFFDREIEFRRSLQYPPDTALINVVVRAAALDRAMADAQDLIDRLRAHGGAWRVMGPAPAAVARIKDEYRAQFFLKGRQRRAMRDALLSAMAARSDLRRRTTVDVDPQSVT